MGIKAFLFVIVGFLFLWVGITGRLGSLLAAIFDPAAMAQGTPSGPGSAPQGVVNPNVNNILNNGGKGVLTPVEIATVAVGAGLTTNLVIAIAVALAESGGNTQARNQNLPVEDSYGLWQINLVAHRNLGFSGTQLLDPTVNAAAMVTISSNGTNWNPWTTYTNGAYKRYLSVAQTAANQAFAGI